MKFFGLVAMFSIASAEIFTLYDTCPEKTTKRCAVWPYTHVVQCRYDDAMLCGIQNCERPSCWTAPKSYFDKISAAQMRGDQSALVEARDMLWAYVQSLNGSQAHDKLWKESSYSCLAPGGMFTVACTFSSGD